MNADLLHNQMFAMVSLKLYLPQEKIWKEHLNIPG